MEENRVRELSSSEVFVGCLVGDLDPEVGPRTSESVDAGKSVSKGGLIGQERAVRAFETAVELPGPGHHVYLFGPPGSGRHSSVMARLREVVRTRPAPDDILYATDLHEAGAVVGFQVPPGQAPVWQERMERLIATLVVELRATFEGRPYQSRQEKVQEELQTHIEQSLRAVSDRLKILGFAVVTGADGLRAVPVKQDGRPYTDLELEQLSGDERGLMAVNGRQVHQELQEVVRERYVLEREARDEAFRIRSETAHAVAERVLGTALEAAREFPKLEAHLGRVVEDICRHPDWLLADEALGTADAQDTGGGASAPAFVRYGLRAVVTHAPDEGAPLVYEDNPTYANLFGRLHYRVGANGGVTTDVTQIVPGSLHAANGGFLVLDAVRLGENPPAFSALLRALRSRTIQSDALADHGAPGLQVTLRIDPVPLRVRVVLIGPRTLLDALGDGIGTAEEFNKLFGVHIEFEPDMERSPAHCRELALLFQEASGKRTDLPLTLQGAARLVEFSARLAGDQRRLSTSLHQPLEVLDEAGVLVRARGGKEIDEDGIDEAVYERRMRVDGFRDRVERGYREGDYLLKVEGVAVGVVNGLAVYTRGERAFGLPSRISARVWAGREGIVDIEQITLQSGPIHTKGIAAIRGYLGGTYAGTNPLSFSSSITFEQMYGPVDGDSASSAELYALLSVLSALPLRQDLAVTGSLSQWGDVQPVGGLNEKIEGFWRVCQALGPMPSQGVLIPAASVHALMLDAAVVRDIEAGRFHVYAVPTVDEGIRLLTGYAASLVHDRVARQLARLRADGGPSGTDAI